MPIIQIECEFLGSNGWWGKVTGPTARGAGEFRAADFEGAIEEMRERVATMQAPPKPAKPAPPVEPRPPAPQPEPRFVRGSRRGDQRQDEPFLTEAAGSTQAVAPRRKRA
jgi:hypothetical protein